MLALLAGTLGIVTIVLYFSFPSCSASNYKLSYILLAIFHFIDCTLYIHDGMAAEGEGLIASLARPRFEGKDVIYVNQKAPEEEPMENRIRRRLPCVLNYLGLAFGLVVFIYI